MSKKQPELAFGVKKVPGGWTMVSYEILDGKVVKEKRTEPDYRDMALESFVRATTIFWLPEEQ
jgi:hypothetical protein